MTPEITITTHHYPGYGSPPSWETRALYGNVLLDEVLSHTAMSAGRQEEILRAEWAREWDKAEFLKALAGKPAASPLCDNCGQDTLGGRTFLNSRCFCTREACKAAIEAYGQQLRDEREKSERESADYHSRVKAQRERQAAKARKGYHWKDGWYFKRMIVDGMVLISKVQGDEIVTQLRIPRDEWESIINSL